MIIILRKWNGLFPSVASTKDDAWFNNVSATALTWILSYSVLTWGCRNAAGYSGEWDLATGTATYQWRCWDSQWLYTKETTDLEHNLEKRFNAERLAVDALTTELNLTMFEHITDITLEKDPAAMFSEELESLIEMHDHELIKEYAK